MRLDLTPVEAPDGRAVFVASSDGSLFTLQRVELGRVFNSLAAIHGLAAGERVAIGNPFFLEAEWRLRGGRGGLQRRSPGWSPSCATVARCWRRWRCSSP